MSRVIFINLVTIFLTACASTYKPSEQFKQYHSELNQKAALEVFHKAFDAKNNSVHLCSTPYITDKDVRPEPTENGFKIRAYKKGEFIKQVGDILYYKKIYYDAHWDVSKVTTIRIRDNDGGINNIVYCDSSLGGKKVILYISNKNYVGIQVDNDYYEKYIAAVSVLAPKARIVEGLGF